MFNCISDTLKSFSKFICWFGISLSVICGIVLIIEDELPVLAIIIVALACCLSSLITSFFLYGLGQLIENSNTIVSIIKKSPSTFSAKISDTTSNNATTPTAVAAPINNRESKHRWKCAGCGNMISESPCPFCSNK